MKSSRPCCLTYSYLPVYLFTWACTCARILWWCWSFSVSYATAPCFTATYCIQSRAHSKEHTSPQVLTRQPTYYCTIPSTEYRVPTIKVLQRVGCAAYPL